MPFDVDPVVKAQLLTERIASLNLEGYQHELNRKTAEAINNPDAILEADSAIAIIEVAIQVAQTELDSAQ
jgi:hypothetical protein